MFVSVPLALNGANHLRILDLRFLGYDHEQVNHFLTSIGPKGRAQYLGHQLIVDMLYPLFFGLSYSLMLAYFLKRTKQLSSYKFLFCYLPFVTTMADYAENFGIIKILHDFENNALRASTVDACSAITVFKFAASIPFFIVLAITIFTFIKQSLKLKQA